MKHTTCLIVLFIVFECASTLRHHRRFAPLRKASEPNAPAPYREYYFDQILDHFNFETKPATYKQRYLVADQYWAGHSDGVCKGPILFYTGNEGDITLFWENTGFVTEYLIQKLRALVIFGEHRYYGKSLPFGANSFTDKNIGYLSSWQALADYSTLIPFLQRTYKAEDCPVFAFGGSYGGMLAAWMRLKYPNIVTGAIAASAPILQFEGTGVSQWSFNEILTNDFTQVDQKCTDVIRAGFQQVLQLGNTAQGRAQLSSTFGLCPNQLNSYNDVLNNFVYNWLEGGLGYMAMTDYPYPANFLEPMPAWPVNVACARALSNAGNPLLALSQAINVYYNYTGESPCYNLTVTTTGDLGITAWDYQACTEMIFPISSNGTSDFFPPEYFNLTAYIEGCRAQFGVTPDPHWCTTYYGGRNIEAGSNIVFSNGMLDPWRSGGVQKTIVGAKDLIAVLIQKGAHHLDMRTPNVADPPSVIEARQIEESFLLSWWAESLKK